MHTSQHHHYHRDMPSSNTPTIQNVSDFEKGIRLKSTRNRIGLKLAKLGNKFRRFSEPSSSPPRSKIDRELHLSRRRREEVSCIACRVEISGRSFRKIVANGTINVPLKKSKEETYLFWEVQSPVISSY